MLIILEFVAGGDLEGHLLDVGKFTEAAARYSVQEDLSCKILKVNNRIFCYQI